MKKSKKEKRKKRKLRKAHHPVVLVEERNAIQARKVAAWALETFPCDYCGLCCKAVFPHIILEDIKREPRLKEHIVDCEPSLQLYRLKTPCPFLDSENRCVIWLAKLSIVLDGFVSALKLSTTGKLVLAHYC